MFQSITVENAIFTAICVTVYKIVMWFYLLFYTRTSARIFLLTTQLKIFNGEKKRRSAPLHVVKNRDNTNIK